MTMTFQEMVREFFDGDEKLIQKWANSDRETLAAIGMVNLTGQMKEADSGFSFAEKIADLEVEDLMYLRYELRDHFLDSFIKDSPNGVDGPVRDIIRGLVDIVEAELGGRWVS